MRIMGWFRNEPEWLKEPGQEAEPVSSAPKVEVTPPEPLNELDQAKYEAVRWALTQPGTDVTKNRHPHIIGGYEFLVQAEGWEESIIVNRWNEGLFLETENEYGSRAPQRAQRKLDDFRRRFPTEPASDEE